MILHRGDPGAPVVVVGDAPTEEEQSNEIVFGENAFATLVDLLQESGFDRRMCVFVNGVSYRKYGTFTPKEIREDADAHLIPFVNQAPRSLIIALGNLPLCALGVTNRAEGVNRYRMAVATSSLTGDVPITASLHTYLLLREPALDQEVLGDLRYANRILSGDRVDQAPIEIRDIETPDDWDAVWAALRKNPYMAYDFETTDLDRDRAVPVTMALCNGLKNNSGAYIVWFWAGYDRLVPRYDPETMEAFRLRMVDFFERAGTDYTLIAWNAGYDDWIAESLAAKRFPEKSFAEWWQYGRARKELPGSQVDAMLVKYTYDNRRPHGLKPATARYLSYPNYDAAVDAAVSEIKVRRRRVLSHPDDLAVLAWYGLEPEVTKNITVDEQGKQKFKRRTPGARWPSDVDKGIAAYAYQPFDVLRTYNAYDAVYTYLLFRKLGNEIDRENLGYSCDFRHRIARELMRCEQNGMLCNVALNREFSKRFTEVVKLCETRMLDELAERKIDMPDFNYRSNDQLARVLFGEPVSLPFIDRTPLYATVAGDGIDTIISDVEDAVYVNQDMPEIRSALKHGHGVDVEMLKTRLIKRATTRLAPFARSPGTFEVRTMDVPCYLTGRYAPVAWTANGKPSTASAVLQTLYQADPDQFLALILMARRADKLRSVYVDGVYQKLDENNVLHASFNATGTETGRISSSNPNGQNFQKSIRGQLIPRTGYKFLEWDLSQAEIRGIAAESRDPQLIAALDSSDIHTRIASLIFKIPEEEVNRDTHRRYAKTIVFGLIYGMSAFRLSLAINVTLEEAEQFMKDFFAAFPKMRQWLDRQVRSASVYPFYVYTPWGTRRSTKNAISIDKKIVAHAERTATNMPIQGGAGELCLWYICEIMDRVRERGYDARLVNTTHDSCTLEIRDDLAWIEGDDVAGPMADLVREVIATPPPVYPLNTVKWKADIELNDWWSAKPNFEKALDPNLGKDESTFRWDLLKPHEVLDPEEEEELREAEEAATGEATF